MAVDIPRLKNLAANIARTLSAVASAPPHKPVASTALERAFADVETLIAAVRDEPSLWRQPTLSTLEKLEQHYGRALGRIIAALGGLPVGTHVRNATLARLIDEDDATRAELLRLDAANNAELLETLFELFVSPRPASARKAAPADAQRESKTAPRKDNRSAAEQAAVLVAERAAFVIPALLPRSDPPFTSPEADPDQEPEHHVDDVKRVEPGARPRKR